MEEADYIIYLKDENKMKLRKFVIILLPARTCLTNVKEFPPKHKHMLTSSNIKGVLPFDQVDLAGLENWIHHYRHLP